MIRSILAVSEGGPDAVTTFGLARRVAGLFGGAVDALYVSDESGGGGMGMPLLLDPERTKSRARNCERWYRELLGDVEGSSYAAAPDDAPLHRLVALGRCTDLVILGRPGADSPKISPRLVTTAIHQCARAVMIAPPRPTSGSFRSVVVAWNGSFQAACALAQAMPFLERASTITLLVVDREPEAADVDVLARNLGRHRLRARIDSIHPGIVSARERGRALLAYVHENDADLLVMGAYGGGMLETFLGVGGATGKVISSCPVPLLVAY